MDSLIKIASITRKKRKQIVLWELIFQSADFAEKDIVKSSFGRKESRKIYGNGKNDI